MKPNKSLRSRVSSSFDPNDWQISHHPPLVSCATLPLQDSLDPTAVGLEAVKYLVRADLEYSNSKLLVGIAPIVPASHQSSKAFSRASQALAGVVLRCSKCVLLEIVTPIQSTLRHLSEVVLEANQMLLFLFYCFIIRVRRGEQGMSLFGFENNKRRRRQMQSRHMMQIIRTSSFRCTLKGKERLDEKRKHRRSDCCAPVWKMEQIFNGKREPCLEV